jgi:hypothetical protein
MQGDALAAQPRAVRRAGIPSPPTCHAWTGDGHPLGIAEPAVTPVHAGTSDQVPGMLGWASRQERMRLALLLAWRGAAAGPGGGVRRDPPPAAAPGRGDVLPALAAGQVLGELGGELPAGRLHRAGRGYCFQDLGGLACGDLLGHATRDQLAQHRVQPAGHRGVGPAQVLVAPGARPRLLRPAPRPQHRPRGRAAATAGNTRRHSWTGVAVYDGNDEAGCPWDRLADRRG